MARFGRVLTAMVTPFTDDGALDLAAAARLARWLVANGNEGLVVAGTTGESPTLTHSEQAELVAAVVQAVDVPVVAGAGSNDTRAAMELSEACAAAGAAGLLHVAGYYNRPSQAGLETHFRHCAAATDLPVIIYDIPARTGRKITTETLVRLAHEVPNIVALKDAAGSVDETARLLALAPDDFEVYSGDDSLTLPLLAVGATGVIGVASHWASRLMLDMIEAFEEGRTAEAAAINRRLIDSYRFESSDDAPNPVPAKCMMRLMGMPTGPCRLPMGPEPDGLEDRAHQVLAALNEPEPPTPDTPASELAASEPVASDAVASDTPALDTSAHETPDSDLAASDTAASEPVASDTPASEPAAPDTPASDTAVSEPAASDTSAPDASDSQASAPQDWMQSPPSPHPPLPLQQQPTQSSTPQPPPPPPPPPPSPPPFPAG
ncbi:MAG: 4-hydroxy-tetrahydrodipicolinate synthase [Acidimicrobiaceae bacterium]|nr:4-hydroxy-tetrahydrodipicolinate synthase [Acidimicrobiaceae bacterium]